MRQSKVTLVKELNAQLMKIHQLANLIEQKNTTGIPNFRDWILESEKLMEKFNLPQMSQLSVIRAELTTFQPTRSKNKRKELFRFGAQLLTRAQEIVWDTSASFSEKTEQASDLILQLLNLIYQSGAFHFDGSEDFTLFLENIWSFCCSHEQLRGISIQVLSLISKSDVLLIMAENIDLEKLR